MTAVQSRLPLVIRRLAGPLVLLAVVVGAVFLLSALGVLAGGVRGRYAELAIGIAAALIVTRVLEYLSFDVVFRLRRNAVAPALLRQLIALLVFGICVSAVVKMNFPGVNLGAVLTTSAILTAVIGLALQDTLGNLFAGLALHLEKTVQVGDMVRSGETFGTVEELSWRAIKLRAIEGNVVWIPNSMAGRDRLEVYQRPGGPIARLLRVGLEYDASPARAREALEGSLRHLPGLAGFPEPVAYMKSFDDHAISYELRYWLEDYARYLEIDSQVRERVWYALDRANLRIAYPLVRQHQWSAGPLPQSSRVAQIAAAIESIDLFTPLTPRERERLVEGARERRYAAGEVIVREGDLTSSMFLIESGRAGVTIHGPARDSRRLAVLDPGSAFGEISLLTGAPRTATVRALTETVLIEIEKETLSPILQDNPTLCEALDAIVQERRRRAADVLDAAREEGGKAEDSTPLAGRIARFFGLRRRA